MVTLSLHETIIVIWVFYKGRNLAFATVRIKIQEEADENDCSFAETSHECTEFDSHTNM